MTYEEFETLQLIRFPHIASPIPWKACGSDVVAILLKTWFEEGSQLPMTRFVDRLCRLDFVAAIELADPWQVKHFGQIASFITLLPKECLGENFPQWTGIRENKTLEYDWTEIVHKAWNTIHQIREIRVKPVSQETELYIPTIGWAV